MAEAFAGRGAAAAAATTGGGGGALSERMHVALSLIFGHSAFRVGSQATSNDR